MNSDRRDWVTLIIAGTALYTYAEEQKQKSKAEALVDKKAEIVERFDMDGDGKLSQTERTALKSPAQAKIAARRKSESSK